MIGSGRLVSPAGGNIVVILDTYVTPVNIDIMFDNGSPSVLPSGITVDGTLMPLREFCLGLVPRWESATNITGGIANTAYTAIRVSNSSGTDVGFWINQTGITT